MRFVPEAPSDAARQTGALHGAPPPDETTLRLADLVQRLRSEPRAALLALRAVALSLGPDVVERVGAGEVTYLRRDKPFFQVDVVRARLVATFPLGVHIADPMGRLLKRGEQQYFRLDGSGDLDAHVQQFVRDAYTQVRAS